jgi:cysteinyl-tRNA synthetase
MGKTLGILQQDPDVYLKRGVGGASATDAEIECLLAKRHAARAARDFKESDRIRDELAAAGIVLEDKAGGVTEWRRS